MPNAVPSAAGYGNLPKGNFSSVIYSKKVQLGLRKSTIVGDTTNTDYFGELSQGTTVRIIKEPEISVTEYKLGTQISAQDFDDENFSLVIDKANYFAFKIDDIEEAHSHVNFIQLETAGSDELLSSMKLKKGDFGNITTGSAGDHSISVAARLPGATALPTETVSPAMLVARMARLMDQQQVDQEGCYLIIDPIMLEIMRDEGSRFLNASFW